MSLISVPWWAPFAVAIALSAITIVFELKTENIPNTITLGLLFAAGCLAMVDGRLATHLGGLVSAALVCGVLYRQDLIGGGTVKWAVALGTLLGMRECLVMMAVTGVIFGAWIGIRRMQKHLITEVPSSPCLLAGVFAALVDVVASQRAWWS